MSEPNGASAVLGTVEVLCHDCRTTLVCPDGVQRYPWAIRCDPCWDRWHASWPQRKREQARAAQEQFTDLSRQTASALVRGGYRTRAEVAAASDEMLLSTRNFGITMLREVRAAIPAVAPVVRERNRCTHCQGTGWEP